MKRVTLDDVKGFVRTERQSIKQGGGAVATDGIIVNKFGLPPLPDFSKFGPVEVTEVAPIRQTIAKNLTTRLADDGARTTSRTSPTSKPVASGSWTHSRKAARRSR